MAAPRAVPAIPRRSGTICAASVAPGAPGADAAPAADRGGAGLHPRGLATPTEAASVGAVGAILLALAGASSISRPCARSCVSTTGSPAWCSLIFIGAAIFLPGVPRLRGRRAGDRVPHRTARRHRERRRPGDAGDVPARASSSTSSRSPSWWCPSSGPCC